MFNNHFNTIIFDLDSTLVTIEGLDWLAERRGVLGDVFSITEQSMNGLLPVQVAFEKKMALIAPNRDDILALGREYCVSLVPDAKETIAALHALGKEVWIVTGNFQPAPNILAAELGIPARRVKGNTLYFDQDNGYAGYDLENPLVRNGGKAAVVNRRIQTHDRRIVFVGDAVTDLETRDFVELFIGFGGIVKRKKVIDEAEISIQIPSLSPILSAVLTEHEKAMVKKSNFRAVLLKAEEYTKNGGLIKNPVYDQL